MSEVRPKVEVLPLAEVERDSELCSLPDDVVARIVGHLETIEIFRVSQVCRNWRHLVFNDASLLTRAEHSLTTHLLTFTEWMDPSSKHTSDCSRNAEVWNSCCEKQRFYGALSVVWLGSN